MQARRSFLVLLFSALLLLASPAFSAGGSAPSGEEVSPRCEAAIDKAAGRYSQCLLKASARHAKKGKKARLLAQQTRCENKFDARVARIEDRFGEDECTSYVSEIADRTVTYAQGVAIEASGKKSPSFLFVQDGTGGTLTKSTLTLTGVSSKTGYFSDRPYREAGQESTEEFITLWNEGETFAEEPPNADFTCEVETDSGTEVVNYVVELTSPSMTGADLSYTAKYVGYPFVLDGTVRCEADSHLFIDDSSSTSQSSQANDPEAPPYTGSCTVPTTYASTRCSFISEACLSFIACRCRAGELPLILGTGPNYGDYSSMCKYAVNWEY